jgi:hypothetical protein
MSFFGFRPGAVAAAAVVEPTFDETMCKRFNDFYLAPLPRGRVRPVFSEVPPPLELVACSNYYPPPRSDGSIPVQITPEVQYIFINFFDQFEPFPSGLARCQDSRNTLKGLKASDQVLFDSPLKWTPLGSPNVQKKFVPIICKQRFLGHVVDYVTKPVVLLWDKYIRDNQQPLDRYQEEYLSTLLQCTLLEGMNRMLEETKGDMTYVATPAETAHFIQFKQKIEVAKKNVERLREQLELIKSSDEADAEELAKNPTLSPLKRRGGKSKRQRIKRQSKRQRSKRQRQRSKRQKSKKYYK